MTNNNKIFSRDVVVGFLLTVSLVAITALVRTVLDQNNRIIAMEANRWTSQDQARFSDELGVKLDLLLATITLQQIETNARFEAQRINNDARFDELPPDWFEQTTIKSIQDRITELERLNRITP